MEVIQGTTTQEKPREVTMDLERIIVVRPLQQEKATVTITEPIIIITKEEGEKNLHLPIITIITEDQDPEHIIIIVEDEDDGVMSRIHQEVVGVDHYCVHAAFGCVDGILALFCMVCAAGCADKEHPPPTTTTTPLLLLLLLLIPAIAKEEENLDDVLHYGQ